jgi:hypothetical protein
LALPGEVKPRGALQALQTRRQLDARQKVVRLFRGLGAEALTGALLEVPRRVARLAPLDELA